VAGPVCLLLLPTQCFHRFRKALADFFLP